MIDDATLGPAFLRGVGAAEAAFHVPLVVGTATLDATLVVDRFDGRSRLALRSRPSHPFVAQGCRYAVSMDVRIPALLAGRIEAEVGDVRSEAAPGSVDLVRSHPVERTYDADRRGERRLAAVLLSAAARAEVHPYLVREVEEALFGMTVRHLAEATGRMAPDADERRFPEETIRSVDRSRFEEAERTRTAFVEAAPAYRHGLGYAFLRSDGRPVRFAVDPEGGRRLGPASGIVFPTLEGICAAAARAGLSLPGLAFDAWRPSFLEGRAALVVVTVDGCLLAQGGWDGVETTPLPFGSCVLVGESSEAA